MNFIFKTKCLSSPPLGEACPRQAGNVVFIVLIAIILFVSLSAAVKQAMESGGGAPSAETNTINSTAFIQYASDIKSAINSLKLLNGCSYEDISFTSPFWTHTDYDHSPVSNSACRVFSSSGGGIDWQVVDARVTDQQWEFIGDTRVHGIGTTDTGDSGESNDLIIALPGLSETMCKNVNKRLGLDFGGVVPENADDIMDTTSRRFNGSYNAGDDIVGSSGGPCPDDLCYIKSACFKEAGGSENYIFYNVLIAR